jgi:hypothetical protein
MDILNWLYLKKQQLIKKEANNPQTDLIVLGAEVPFTERGDGYQNYAMTLANGVQSGNQGNTAHYELDMTVTNTVTVNTTRGIIDIIGMGTAPFLTPDPAFAFQTPFYINNPDLDLTIANRDKIPYLISTGFIIPNGVGFNLYNANPAVATANNWTGALYVYYELYTIN